MAFILFQKNGVFWDDLEIEVKLDSSCAGVTPLSGGPLNRVRSGARTESNIYLSLQNVPGLKQTQQ